ncbi:DUF4062 domain-containing protein [Hymenobacter rigui]|uniref:DUF4062 domain-containing protein n=1 Tax=Hymenobacter rigui TaxID=334424 RepID=A0A428KU27_9BACT|nr:DUF4062 domain-containing protein [Hymenobacter rigui]RSK50118.1 DUF4062 domain-containing protein [Hymenobacter rigui]
MDKKYQVFISSTFIDLTDQRRRVVDTILRMGHLPVGMELFNAADDSQWEIIKTHIDNSDYYLLILAHRYGTEADDGLSYTEKEFNYALGKGIPCLAFIIDKSVKWNAEFVEKGKKATKLNTFKAKFTNRLVNYWTSTEDLAAHVSLSLSSLMTTKPRVGWVRADTVSNNVLVLEELSRLSRENSELRLQVDAKGNDIDSIEHTEKVLSAMEYQLELPSGIGTGTFLDLFKALGNDFMDQIGSHQVPEAIKKALTGSPHASVDVGNLREVLLRNAEILGLVIATRSPSGTYYFNMTEKGRRLLVHLSYPLE